VNGENKKEGKKGEEEMTKNGKTGAKVSVTRRRRNRDDKDDVR